MAHQCEQRSNVNVWDRGTGRHTIRQRRHKIGLATTNRPLPPIRQSHGHEVSAARSMKRYQLKPQTIQPVASIRNRHMVYLPVERWGTM